MLANINKKLNNKGFTLTELIISSSLIGLVTIGLIGLTFSFFNTITRSRLLAYMTTESQNLLRTTVEEIRYGSGIATVNLIDDPYVGSGGPYDPYTSPDWSTSQANVVIIINQPVVDSVTDDYSINSLTGAPYNNELIYFKDGDKLYRRTLANTAATNNPAVTTCPVGTPGNCKKDALLSSNLDEMTFVFYDQDNILTTDLPRARSVEINLKLKTSPFGKDLKLENNIRVTLRNRFS